MKQDIFNQYVEAVLKMFKVERSELFSNSLKRNVIDARQLLYYLCYIRPMKISYIQRYMTDNGYDPKHVPIIRGIRRVEKKMEEDRDYQSIVSRVQNSIFI
jgi:chromosomal replication initiation ATPase DnaA